MPRIADYMADCSIYLYESEEDAREGAKYGGSGFLVHVPSAAAPTMGHIYAVTNKHVIDPPPEGGGCTVLRLSKKNGGIDTIPTQWADWIPDPDGDDVAVLPLDIKDFFRWWSVGTDKFINNEIIDAYNIGFGDEAFLVGRLIHHDGKQKNAPIIRFGNVSLMADPAEPIQVKGRLQEGFLVECRSLSGFSGSPVFVMTSQAYTDKAAEKVMQRRQKELTAYDALQDDRGTGHYQAVFPAPDNSALTAVLFKGTFGPWLLGIDWGHMPLWTPVYRNGEKTDMRVESNTGIACVLPAWHILQTLNVEELVKKREDKDKQISKHDEDASVNDFSEREKPFTKEDFESALQKASRKVPPPARS